MKLNRVKLNALIEETDIRNDGLLISLDSVMGMTITKKLIPTKADVSNSDISKFKLVLPNHFVINPRTHGKKIGLAFNDSDSTVLISWNNISFKIKNESIILPRFLFMFFNRGEWDRRATFCSWGSSTEVFSFEELGNMEIVLPPIEIQKKYVAIYESLLTNLQVYEKGLDDLKLVYEGYIEDLRRKIKAEPIGPYISQRKEKNTSLEYDNVLGISKEGFISPKQKPGELNNYFIFENGDFVYSPPRINVGSIGLYHSKEKAICSPIYIVFKTNDENKLLSEYLNLWLHRKEFFRSTDFYSIGSVRNNFSYELMESVKIPVPEIGVQKSIAAFSQSHNKRLQIKEKIESILDNICPILLKGSIEEMEKL